ncbi:MAG: hypothetical protein A3C90_04185 [Candidatus Magasanikbacteria bacterium RIFCSPHIGHO2_02_FULL_51_14]|uniref:DUF304 domain-containing protein n=1 Tax=Candidatus Magasanikbacteria bacterium RIFCSPHIGHO2_02_FULL_51_14 TaxID=1798683 RepID=A0A1F6MD75_9BACT|nr:MAG: hypothetical protein A3C90_04185 [Candidatus Magasanikbacteria bacterium RIFCSPHIGHO2_02_FULL_51_14]
MSLSSRIHLKEHERIVDAVRRYGLTYFWSWLLIAILFGVPFLFLFWLFRHGWWGQALFFIPVTLATLLLVRTLFFWRKNVLVMTTHRVIDMEQRGFFELIVSEIPYDQVGDISGKIKGVWGTLLGYGTLFLQTGNGNVRIFVEKVRRPIRLQQEMNLLRRAYVAKLSEDMSGNVAGAIIEKLRDLPEDELQKVTDALEERKRRTVS